MEDQPLGGSIIKNEKRELSPEQSEELLRVLKARFEKNMMFKN
jgi:hypothetical protein